MQLQSKAFETLLSGVIFTKALDAITGKYELEEDPLLVLLFTIELYRKCDKWPTPELVRIQSTYSQEEFAQLMDELRAADFIAVVEGRVQVTDKGVALLNSMYSQLKEEMDYRANHMYVSKETKPLL